MKLNWTVSAMRPVEIDQRLADSGYSLSLTDKSRYLYHMTQRLISCGGWDSLHTPYMTRLWLSAGVRKGRAYTLSELRQIAQPRQDEMAFMEGMMQLVNGAVFKRCVRLKCEHCALEQTHPPRDLDDPITCAGCLNAMQLPLEAPFAYIPNPLFCTGMSNGLLTLMRVLWRFDQSEPVGVWVGGVLIQKGNGPEIEVDLLYLAGDTLHIVEAKDALPENSAIQMQMLRYRTLAEELGGVCTLASLPTLPPDLSAWCADWGISVLAG